MSEPAVLDWRAAGLFRLGEDAQLRERYADASGYYLEVVRVATDHEPAWFNLGVSELRRGHATVAGEIFGALLEPEPRKLPSRDGPAGQGLGPDLRAALAARTPAPRPKSHRLPITFNLALALACAGDRRRASEIVRDIVLDTLDSPPEPEGASKLPARIEGPALALLAVLGWGSRRWPRFGRTGAGTAEVPEDLRRSLVARLRRDGRPDRQTAALAARLARETHARDPRTQYFLACFDAPEPALDALEEALSNDPQSIEWARRDPLLRPLRARRPREFRAIIRAARAARAASAPVGRP